MLMKKIIFALSISLLVILTSCQFKPDTIILPNGQQGLVIDCTNIGWPGCFKVAGDACKNGYAIHERTQLENTQSEIPVKPLPEIDLTSRMPIPEAEIKQQYMVISCS